MPSTPAGISGTPDVPGQPYDATQDGTISKWVSVNKNSGPCDMQGNVTGEFPSSDGWSQT